MRRLRHALIAAAIVAVGGLAAGAPHYATLADLRPPEVREPPTAAQQAKGRRLLAQMVDALGGEAAWDAWSGQRVAATVQDTWHSRSMSLYMGTGAWSGQPVRVAFPVDNNQDLDLTFLGGPWAGEQWHLDGGSDAPWPVQFWPQTYRYFAFPAGTAPVPHHRQPQPA